MLGVIFAVRIVEAMMLYAMIVDRTLPIKTMMNIFLFGALFQIILGALQWQLNGSLGLSILGESQIGPEIKGVAKLDLEEGVKQVRAYGTFLHSNIMAGYLAVVFFLLLNHLKKARDLIWLVFIGGGMFLTYSRAAILVTGAILAIYLVFQLFKSPFIRRSVALVFVVLLTLTNLWFFQKSALVNVDDASWSSRLEQIQISRSMWQANPWGVGVGDFTLEMNQLVERKLLPWEFQPVHNTYFLILNEVGLQGLLILLLILLYVFHRYWHKDAISLLMLLLLLAPMDHFLWDSYVGIMLIAVVMGFLTLNKKSVDDRLD